MKRTSVKVGLGIIVLGIALFAWIINFSYSKYKDLPNNFVTNRQNIGEKLYGSVMERDLTVQYPSEPLAVMEFYKDTVFLLYGDMIINDDLIKDVIDVQRQLWSDELLATTTAQEQFDNLKKSLETLNESKIRMLKAEVTSTNYDPFDANICIVNLSEYFLNLDRVEWQFYLIKDSEGNWKINTWELISH